MISKESARADGTSETYDALRGRIRDRFDDLTPHLQRIARFAMEEPNQFALNTVVVIADHVGVQPSTLIRFSKEFGYSGFSPLQRIFRLRLIEGPPDKRDQIYDLQGPRAPTADMGQVLNSCIDELVASLEGLRASTNPEDLAQAVSLINDAQHIHIAGLRRARPIATYLAYGISRTERHCSLLDFGGGMAEQQIVNMRPEDLLISVSFPPYAPMVLDVTRDAYLRRRKVIAITDTPESPLAKNATLAFAVDHETSNKFKPISGAIAVVQALCVGLGD